MTWLSTVSLEEMLTAPAMFGLTTATNLQRAICRIIDGVGLGELADDPDVLEAIGDVHDWATRPNELVLLGGVRTAKSLLAAAIAIRCSQRVELPSWLKPGEVPRVSIVSLDKDKARVVLNDHLLATLKRPDCLLRFLVVSWPAGPIGLIVRHPTGRHIEIAVRAGKRAGGDLVSRWSAGCIFDEAPRMTGAADGVVNLDDARDAVASRLLPGALMADMGSPWAPMGPVYQMFSDNFQKPTKACVVVRARGPQMNPFWWTEERCAELKEVNPDSYATDVEARFLSGAESLFSETLLAMNTRPVDAEGFSDLEPNPHASYWAAMDPATRGNAWTLMIATRTGKTRRIACAREWIGTTAQPLVPREVFREMSLLLRSYGLDTVESDQYYIDALVDIASTLRMTDDPASEAIPIRIVQSKLSQQEKTQEYLDIRTKLMEKELELHPAPQLRADLVRLKRRATQAGISIDLPVTQDGRHCDYAPVLMLVCARNLADVKDPPRRVVDPLTEEQRKRDFARLQKKQRAA